MNKNVDICNFIIESYVNFLSVKQIYAFDVIERLYCFIYYFQ